ncbi:hypothetical protein F4861DRAFT_464747 [Xylaria intraflava]|nr:hypothetical protein F4861DRAFT_464747 [Xylaria intraflava]
MPPKPRKLAGAKAPASGSRRRSTRLSSTAKRSSYFEEDDVDDSEETGAPPRKTARTAANASRSRRQSRNEASDDELQYEESEDDEENGDSEVFDTDDDSATPPPPKSSPAKRRRGPPAKNPRARPQTGKSQEKAAGKATNSRTVEKSRGRVAKAEQTSSGAKRVEHATRRREDVDDDDSDDDEDEGLQATTIPLPKLRDTNGIEYEDTKVHPNTLLFLGDLKANNERDWLHMHDPEYRRSLKDWSAFVEKLTDKIVEADETIPELPVKDVIFRIYRDIRFSKDPTPYKAHYSAAWSRTGRKGPYACYYVHIEPGNCLVGGGLWHPEASALAKLRASIDERPHRIRRVLTNPEFVRAFLPNVIGKKEGKILEAFADRNQENALKTKPKGFNPEHRDIHLLKLRNYTIGRHIPDEDLHADDAQEKIMAIIRPMVPLITYLNKVVMPDPGEDSSSDDGDGNEEEQESDDEDEDEEE